jgi:Uma2 family endonuclease
MSNALEKDGTYYTYADYLAWDTDQRYELINGEPYMMSSPTVTHQAISGELFGQFWNFLKGKPCQVFAAPLDVRLFPREDNSDDTILQPDILVVCDAAKLADKRSCRGAPDLVIELLSPSKTDKAALLKFKQCLKAGVREYWVIDPETQAICVHILGKNEGIWPAHYISAVYDHTEAMEVSILPGLRIDCTGIWSLP